MNKTEVLYSAVLVFGVFISSISQVILKKSSAKKHTSFLREYLNPYVIGAYLIFFAATFMSVFAYKVVPLSRGAILDSTGYLFITVLGAIFLGEKINYRKIISLAIIISGIIVFSI